MRSRPVFGAKAHLHGLRLERDREGGYTSDEKAFQLRCLIVTDGLAQRGGSHEISAGLTGKQGSARAHIFVLPAVVPLDKILACFSIA